LFVFVPLPRYRLLLAEFRLFLGIAGLGLMANGTYNVGLSALCINRVFYGFAVNSKAFILLSVRFMPVLQG
jgi:hypothetical protein